MIALISTVPIGKSVGLNPAFAATWLGWQAGLRPPTSQAKGSALLSALSRATAAYSRPFGPAIYASALDSSAISASYTTVLLLS